MKMPIEKSKGPWKKAKKLKLKDSVKEELVNAYHSSRGMSGASNKLVNKEFIVKYRDGNNIVVEDSSGNSLSLHEDRFEPIETNTDKF
jgi:hypothetical protein